MKKVFCFSLLMCLFLAGCKNNIKLEEFSFDTVQSIAELAVLKCKFNNVAVFNKPKDRGIFSIFQKEKQAFVEYTVDVKIGVRANNIKIDEENHSIIIPKAEILSANEIGGSIVASKDGLKSNKIDRKQEKETYVKYTEEMKSDIIEDGTLLKKAQKIVRDNILQYIDLINSDIKYKVILE